MSTRSCIARLKGDGFEGVYHHWDGYPTALGATLYKMAQDWLNARQVTTSAPGIPGMLRLLIDEHPAGWSTINGVDWSQEPGYHNDEGSKRPCCYCHGHRSEQPQPVTHEDDMGMEWAYVFNEEGLTMAVCERVRPEGEHAVGMFGTLGKSRESGEREDAWAIRAVIQLDGPAPDWERVECGPNLEHCHHYRWKHDPTICRQCDGDGVYASSSHRVGYGDPCNESCVPAPEAPKALKDDEGGDWHIVRPEGGFTCDRCGGSGREPVGAPA